MNCRNTRDGLLANGDSPALDRHLDDCAACTEFASRLAETRSALVAHHARARPDAAFASRVAASVPSGHVEILGRAALRLLPATLAVLAVLAWFTAQTGGTGPAPRDVTPEAIEEACQKMMPGFGELMRKASLDAGVPTAILSRQTAGIAGKSLVVTLPGKPGSIRVCLDAIMPAIPYCIDLIGGPYLEGNPEVVQVFRPQKK